MSWMPRVCRGFTCRTVILGSTRWRRLRTIPSIERVPEPSADQFLGLIDNPERAIFFCELLTSERETQMSRISTIAVWAMTGLGLALILGCRPSAAASGNPVAEEVFENIQVLKGVPAGELIPTMHVFS